MNTEPTTQPARRSLRERDPGIDLVPIRPRRRPWLIATGVLLASIGALAVVWLVGAAGQRQEVLAVRQEVGYGEVLAEADLTLARVSVDPGVSVLPAAARTQVIGQVATTRLVPGMLLGDGMVEPTGEPGPGRVLVPVALRVERMPAGGLRPGDRILAVPASSDGALSGAAQPGAPAAASSLAAARDAVAATVVRVGPMDVNGVTVVDVTTTESEGPGLAVSAANGQVALVVQPSRG